MIRKVDLPFFLVMIIVLTMYFRAMETSAMNALYFIIFLSPVCFLGAYVFSEVLIPKYLLNNHWKKFIIYSIYLAIIVQVFIFLFAFLAIFYLVAYDKDLNIITEIDLPRLILLIFVMYLIRGGISFYRAYQQYLQKANEKEEESSKSPLEVRGLTIRENRKSIVLPFDDIQYLENRGDYVRLVCQNNNHLTKATMKHLLEKLPENFVQIHRSYVVNIDHVQEFGADEVFIGGKPLAISRSNKKKIGEIVSNQLS